MRNLFCLIGDGFVICYPANYEVLEFKKNQVWLSLLPGHRKKLHLPTPCSQVRPCN